MAKRETGTAKATFKNYSEAARNTPDWGADVDAEYEYEYDVLENMDEVAAKFSKEQIVTLANQRLKGNANSAARAKKEAEFKLDPNSPEAKMAAAVKSLVQALGISEDKAREIIGLAQAS